MDALDAMVLLYLSKTWNEQSELSEYAHKFQQTRDELDRLLRDERGKSLKQSISDGSFSL